MSTQFVRFVYRALGVMLIASMVLTACGGAAAPATEAPKAAEATPVPAAAEPTATPAPAAPPAAGQRQLVWMARTEPTENKWEQQVVIPAFE